MGEFKNLYTACHLRAPATYLHILFLVCFLFHERQACMEGGGEGGRKGGSLRTNVAHEVVLFIETKEDNGSGTKTFELVIGDLYST